MMIPIEGHPNLYRDPSSGAIINTDSYSYDQYIKVKTEKKNQKEEIENIKNEISEIKQLLMELISKNGT